MSDQYQYPCYAISPCSYSPKQGKIKELHKTRTLRPPQPCRTQRSTVVVQSTDREVSLGFGILSKLNTDLRAYPHPRKSNLRGGHTVTFLSLKQLPQSSELNHHFQKPYLGQEPRDPQVPGTSRNMPLTTIMQNPSLLQNSFLLSASTMFVSPLPLYAVH